MGQRIPVSSALNRINPVQLVIKSSKNNCMWWKVAPFNTNPFSESHVEEAVQEINHINMDNDEDELVKLCINLKK